MEAVVPTVSVSMGEAGVGSAASAAGASAAGCADGTCAGSAGAAPQAAMANTISITNSRAVIFFIIVFSPFVLCYQIHRFDRKVILPALHHG